MKCGRILRGINHEISKLLVRSILLRKEFGGMKGDMRMLGNAARSGQGV